MSRRESVGRLSAARQSSSGPPTQKMVSVAVLPPRLPEGVAPPTGLGTADAFSWEESINWQHNKPINAPEKKQNFLRKAGLTTQRTKRNPDLPPFVLRQIPYDVWRKHYAKDKDGNYHGTHAPAEDCLLKPDDVAKWRLGEPQTRADLWTRGREALPVYAEVKETARLPEYEVHYDGPPREEPIITEDDDLLASHLEKKESAPSRRPTSLQPVQEIHNTDAAGPARNTSTSTTSSEPRKQTIADGKTAEEIIAEYEAKKASVGKLTWKQKMKKGAEYASMGWQG